MSSNPPSSRRKRGGQPGNFNALKHGFYSRNFTRQEGEDLEARLAAGLDDEIAMFRVVIRRAFEMASKVANDESDLELVMGIMNGLGLASLRLGSLLKIQQMLGKADSSGVAAAISQALAEVAEEMGLGKDGAG